MSELDKLEEYLMEHKIVHRRIDKPFFCDEEARKLYVSMGMENGFGERHQIIAYDKRGQYSWDAICHWGSYGYKQGLLEIMGSIVNEEEDGDCVVGFLTAQDVIERLEKNEDH